MKAILFIGTVRELQQRLALCKLHVSDLVTYASRQGIRSTAPAGTKDDEHLRNFAQQLIPF